MLYFIFIEYGVYIFVGDFRQKKHANKPNLTLIKNKWHQVHTNTLIRAYFNFISLVFCLFFLSASLLLRDRDSRCLFLFLL